MLNVLFTVWLVGWLALGAVSLSVVMFKHRRGTLTEDDIFNFGMSGLLLALWPLWIVSGVLTAIALAAVTAWESRAENEDTA